VSNIAVYIIVFSLALSVTLVLTRIALLLGERYNIRSAAGGRRLEPQMTKLGGIALFGGFMVAVLAAQLLPVPRLDPMEVVRLIGLLLGGTVIFIVGLMDDFFEFGAFPQYLGQLAACSVAVIFQIFIETLNNPLSAQQTEPWPYIVTVTLTVFWLGLMMNTTNFLDGLDGLASGVAFIAGTMLFINSAFRVDPPQTSVSLLPLALMGTSLGFLLYNFHPARIFMGGGALFLGYLLGTLSIIGGAKMATILLVMGLPLMDVAWQALNRLRKGRNPFSGDRGHVHFRLVDMGFGQRQIVLVYYCFCAFFGILTLIAASQLFKLIALSVMMALVMIGFVVLSRSRTPIR